MKDFHHYKGEDLNKFEKVERKVIELIFVSDIEDKDREDSKYFEFMHAAGCMEVGRILAQKRNLDVDIASVICILHDISVIKSGTYKNHAKLGAEIGKGILEEVGEYSNEEITTITNAIAHHSEKEVYANEPYTELVKDADVFECSLYKNAKGFYKTHKPDEIFKEYENRIKKVRGELGLKPEDAFR